jgi:phosphatidylserine/phosphatidylglycerophosphate/cardiolipin synthase-like enzyme
LVVATVIFLASIGLALYLYLGGEWSTVAAAIDRGREYVPEFRAPSGEGLSSVRERLAEWIEPNPEPVMLVERPGDGIEVFFSPVDESRPDGPDDRLVALIRSAERSVYAAFYELDYAPVAEALIDRHKAGADVRLVSDTEYKKRDGIRACIAAGIPVEFDQRSAFMHNKFCVVDNEWVWTGSTNVTRNGFFYNNNNAILLRSPTAAENFAAEFGEMFTSRSFGGRSPRNTRREAFELGASTIEIYFAPEDGVERQIRAEIGEADDTIDFMAFSFTSKPIAEAMADRMKWGVTVRGLVETRGAGSRYCRDNFLAARGATIYLDDNPKTMHHKVIVVDGDTVITGSYNFSKSAEKSNDENVLIVHSADVAGSFTAEFERLTAGL